MSSGNSWFRVWGRDVLLSDSLVELTDHEERVWWRLLCAASISDTPWAARVSAGLARKCMTTPDELVRVLARLAELGMVDLEGDTVRIANADRYQPAPSQTAEKVRERVNRYRGAQEASAGEPLPALAVASRGSGPGGSAGIDKDEPVTAAVQNEDVPVTPASPAPDVTVTGEACNDHVTVTGEACNGYSRARATEPEPEQEPEQDLAAAAARGRVRANGPPAVREEVRAPSDDAPEEAPGGDEVALLTRHWERATGTTVTPMLADWLDSELGRGTPVEWLRDAITETGANGVRAWKYTRSIVERWRAHGRDSPAPPARDRYRRREVTHADAEGRPWGADDPILAQLRAIGALVE